MFEKIDLSKKLSKSEYKKVMREIEIRIGQLQRQAYEMDIPVMLVFEGWDTSGKGSVINELILPMNPRHFTVYTMHEENDDEKRRPFLWRFWIKTPARGEMAIFDRSWYRRIMDDVAQGEIRGKELEGTYREINMFERQLYEDDFVIIKFFLHISKQEQTRRMESLMKDESTKWRVSKSDWEENANYERYKEAIEKAIQETDTGYAPWTIVESEDGRFATVKTLMHFIESMEKNIERISRKRAMVEHAASAIAEGQNEAATLESAMPSIKNLNSSMLDKIDLSVSIENGEYKKELSKLQKRMKSLANEVYLNKIPVVIVYEGWDAAGKGGNIKRLAASLDPRGYQVIPIGAPNDIEKRHNYMWRFWNQLPKTGHFAIFDRSWYGRVLVERVEGFASEWEWKRAYREIREFEESLVNFGAVVIKYWIHIDRQEQLERFNARENDPNKKWKITQEDWRNRYKWDNYKDAVDEMLFRTSTTYAPWTIVESNSKKYARIKTLSHTADELEKAVKAATYKK